MATGIVVQGKIVVADESLQEGATVTVLLPQPTLERGFELSAKDEAALLEAIEEAESGRLTDGNEVLRELGCSG